MRAARLVGVLAFSLLAAACGAKPRGSFDVRFIKPSRYRQAPEPPRGFVVESAVKVGQQTADWSELRFFAARAAAAGAPGIAFQLPSTPAGLSLHRFPEEWQALTRVAREMNSARPIFENGVPAVTPDFAQAPVKARSWALQGRRYVLLVNDSEAPAPLADNLLASWRALFEARSDARELLAPCGEKRCLPAHGVLWLESRLFDF